MKRGIAKDVFRVMETEGCRQITFHFNPKTNLRLIWVIDSIAEKRDKSGKLRKDLSTSGGTRFAHKDSDSAFQDALRLARAMTRKANVLGVSEGGSKAVVIANQKKSKVFLASVG